MIRVVRTAQPAILASANAVRWTDTLCRRRAEYYRQLFASKRDPAIAPPKRSSANHDHYAHPEVRAALKAMFGPKCAYCEGEVSATSHQHVEHFRPASRYPALAYQWDNLMLACQQCNSTYKSDRFPIAPVGNTPRENRRSPCVRIGIGETPLLVNPCDDNPANHLSFQSHYVVALDERGRRTRRVCGLNRDALVQSRRKHLTLVRYVIEQYLAPASQNSQSNRVKITMLLRDLCDPYSQYAGMVRAELTHQGIDWTSL